MRTRLALPRLFAVMAAAALLLMAAPASASACILTPAHKFLPWPPCPKDDKPLKGREAQLHAHLVANLVQIAEQVQTVEAEVRGWQNAYQAASNFEQSLREAHGTLSANPLPSFVMAYNRTPVGQTLVLGPDGKLHPGVPGSIDPRTQADNLWQRFSEPKDIIEGYYGDAQYSVGRVKHGPIAIGQVARETMTAVGDFRTASDVTLNALETHGNTAANQFGGSDAQGGLAAARIGGLASIINRARATGLRGEVQSLQLRTLSIENLQTLQADQNRLQTALQGGNW